MDRYHFEDLISDYIENALPLETRKEFESYMERHSDARDLVNSISEMMTRLHSQPMVSVSSDFMPRLMSKVNQAGTIAMPGVSAEPRTWWGFQPRYAMLMSGLVLALAFVGYELIPNAPSATTSPIPFASQQTHSPAQLPNPTLNTPETPSAFASTTEDTTSESLDQDLTKPDFGNKIQLVKNPR